MDVMDRIADLLYQYQKDVDIDSIDWDLIDDPDCMSDIELLNAVLEQFDEELVEENELSYLEYKMFIERNNKF